ncbi:FKBP-type peptidyl-prolyl cis-trans isomerase [Patescibacteria group bacterium]|nr:FKBP-type peptidyl-prolyl cis-trans isomerase [Patescibacteria group bacterium]
MSSNNNDINKVAEMAKAGDTVSMNYTGRLEDGTVFDSNVDPKFNHVQPFDFTLGAGQVIPGWDKGIVGMTVGEKKTLTILPEDAYGANGIPGVIPPNSTLIFDVELIGIK